jgi:hypothetical protein
MIAPGAAPILLLLASVAAIAVAMAFISLAGVGVSDRLRRWVRPGAAISGLASGLCLGAAGMWGRSRGTLLAVALAAGLVLGASTTAIAHQVVALSSRAQKPSETRAQPDRRTSDASATGSARTAEAEPGARYPQGRNARGAEEHG